MDLSIVLGTVGLPTPATSRGLGPGGVRSGEVDLGVGMGDVRQPVSSITPQGHHRAEAEGDASGLGPEQCSEGDEEQAQGL